ncbi:MAG: F0F1 ATP synthase subunit epsilon [Streptosporangiaceae bacterium]
MTLRVELVVPEGEIWAGTAERVIAKTLDGDVGILSGHTPVLGILAVGSLVRILPDGEEGTSREEVVAAVAGGFLSVADDQVSVLARQAQLGTDVDRAAAQSALDAAQETPGAEESDEVRYAQAVLRAAGDRS